jgi:hypothetical protein
MRLGHHYFWWHWRDAGLEGLIMNQPAFPLHNHGAQTLGMHLSGMTLRDYFAASFVKSGHVFKSISSGNTPELVAEQAYAMADAMLKAREA